MGTAQRTALLAGATGLVGRELARLLAEDERYEHLYLLVRREAPELARLPKVTCLLVSYDALPPFPAVDDVYIALGTTIGAAGSREAFRRVDHDYVVEVARAAHAAGASRLGVVSALGADPRSRVFYNRVKGQAEQALAALGYTRVVIAQPSLLLGDRESLGQPARTGERWARRILSPVAGLVPVAVRPVSARAVAASLIEAVRTAPPGLVRISSRALHSTPPPRPE